MELARKALKEERYKAALELARGAESYDYSKKNEVDGFIDQIFEAVQQKRIDAQNLKKSADKAKERERFLRLDADQQKLLAKEEAHKSDSLAKLANLNAKKAQDEAHNADQNKELAKSSLQKFENASSEIVNLYVKEVNQFILVMDYDGASNRLIDAAKFNKKTDAFQKAATEIVFWFNETNNIQRASELAKEYLGGVEPVGDSIRELIKKTQPFWYFDLINRYYGNQVQLPGGKYTFHTWIEERVSPFSIGETEVTFWQFGLFFTSIGGDIYDFSEKSWGIRGDEPIVNVSWKQAAQYSNWLSERFNLQQMYNFSSKDVTPIIKGYGFRLPTETEWEYAAKLGQEGDFITKYAGYDELESVGWSPTNAVKINPVASKMPNKAGIYDMSGNVWEWCNDYYASYPRKNYLDYLNTKKAKRMVLRGGSWKYAVSVITRSGFRVMSTKNYKSNDVGFRIARSIIQGDSLFLHDAAVKVSTGDKIDSTKVLIRKITSLKTIDEAFNLDRTDVVSVLVSNMAYGEASIALAKINHSNYDTLYNTQRMELVFWYNETGEIQRANNLIRDYWNGLDTFFRDRTAIRTFLKNENLIYYEQLQKKYYGSFIPIIKVSTFKSESPRFELDPFTISQTETTQFQYNLFLASQNRKVMSTDFEEYKNGKYPAHGISWIEAIYYCNWLNKQFGYDPTYIIKKKSSEKYKIRIVSKKGFRLPYEVEWIFVANEWRNPRAPKHSKVSSIDERLQGIIQIVGQEKPNNLGLYDLDGNVWEWCNDPFWLRIKKYDLGKLRNGKSRVLKGGSTTKKVDIHYRKSGSINLYHSQVGFRVVLVE